MQGVGQGARRLKAPVCLFLQRFQDDAFQRSGQAGHNGARRRRRLLHVLDEQRGDVIRVEGELAGGHLVKDDAQAVNIRPAVKRQPLGLFW